MDYGTAIVEYEPSPRDATERAASRPTAWRLAQDNADECAHRVACALGDARLGELESAAYNLGRHIGHGHLDRADAADILDLAVAACGLYADIGIDAVQDAMSAGFIAGERAALDERAADLEARPNLHAVTRCLADVRPKRVEWLGILPLGKVSLMAGPPGAGKSQISCRIAASVTTGEPFLGRGNTALGSVVMIACEDDAEDTVRPRMEAAGADLGRVHLIDWAITSEGKQRHLDLREHVENLDAVIRQIGDVRLLVVDPATAYLGRADSHVTAEVRQALAPIQALAAKAGIAVLLITHLNKGGGDGSAMSRVTGSGAFVAVARTAWLVGLDPNDPSKRRRILAPIKNNLAPDRGAFAYTIEPATVADGITTSCVLFDPQAVMIDADQLLQPMATDDDCTALGEAVAFLKQELADGAKPVRDVERSAGQAGIAKRTLVRARKQLGLKPKKDGDTWSLMLPRPTH